MNRLSTKGVVVAENVTTIAPALINNLHCIYLLEIGLEFNADKTARNSKCYKYGKSSHLTQRLNAHAATYQLIKIILVIAFPHSYVMDMVEHFVAAEAEKTFSRIIFGGHTELIRTDAIEKFADMLKSFEISYTGVTNINNDITSTIVTPAIVTPTIVTPAIVTPTNIVQVDNTPVEVPDVSHQKTMRRKTTHRKKVSGSLDLNEWYAINKPIKPIRKRDFHAKYVQAGGHLEIHEFGKRVKKLGINEYRDKYNDYYHNVV
jgi:hypothetical protein